MQPYFLPYIGYFQLMNAVDLFVIYDDVNFIKGGWINRNRILVQNQPGYLNIPLVGASSFKKINEIGVGENREVIINKIYNSYSKAPFFQEIFPFFRDLINYESNVLSLYLSHTLNGLADYLGLRTKFILSSEIEKDNILKGQDKVIAICQALQAQSYYNAIGGVSLYSKDIFSSKNIELKFVRSKSIEYPQLNNEFFSNLSILDVLMFNGKNATKEYLDNYELV
jgi:hypothetical protein